MAKASKSRKEEPIQVTSEIETPFDKQPIASEEIEVAANKILVGAATEKQKEPEPNAGITSAVITEPVKAVYRKELDHNLSFEERIEAFIDSRGHGGVILLNDFLKSLYGVPPANTPPKWQNQRIMRELGHTLGKMHDSGTITILKDAHKRLGKHYYEGIEQRQMHHDLGTITIEAKK